MQTGKAERRPTPARLHGPMASQDVEGKLTRKAGRGALPTGPPQDWLAPKGQTAAGARCSGPNCQGHGQSRGHPLCTAYPQTAPWTALCPSFAQQTVLSTYLLPQPRSQSTTSLKPDQK